MDSPVSNPGHLSHEQMGHSDVKPSINNLVRCDISPPTYHIHRPSFHLSDVHRMTSFPHQWFIAPVQYYNDTVLSNGPYNRQVTSNDFYSGDSLHHPMTSLQHPMTSSPLVNQWYPSDSMPMPDTNANLVCSVDVTQHPGNVDRATSSPTMQTVIITTDTQESETKNVLQTIPSDSKSNSKPIESPACVLEDSSDSLSKKRKHEEIKTSSNEKENQDQKCAKAIFNYKRYPKPPYTYVGMLITVIENSPEKRLTLSEIHVELGKMFPFFRGAYTGWKDSIRHNLSANRCFYKDQFAAGDPRGGNKNRGLWRVDLNLVFPDTFQRQETEVAKSGNWAAYLHEQLGTPPIVLPWQNRGQIKAHNGRQMLKKRYRKSSSTFVNSPESFGSIDGDSRSSESGTPEVTNQPIRIRFPSASSCVLPMESPDINTRRDPTTNIDLSSSFEESRIKTPVRPHIQVKPYKSMIKQTSGISLPGLKSLFDFIRSTHQTESSHVAAENLSSLCGPSNPVPTQMSMCPPAGSYSYFWSPVPQSPNVGQHSSGSRRTEVNVEDSVEPEKESQRYRKEFSISALVEDSEKVQ